MSSQNIMVREFADIRQASRTAVKYIIDIAGAAVADKGFCTIVLAGGTTPKLTYELLSLPANAAQINWQQCHLFWGDERWVTAEHPDSNYFMAVRALLSKIPIPPQNIHRISTEYKDPATGAAMYEKHLHHFFHRAGRTSGNSPAENNTLPRFDLILLGMGTDGHTASLFPRSPLLGEKRKWVASVPGGTGSPPVPRITLTLPVFNQADNVLFLIAGQRKRALLHAIQARPKEAAELYPAARIKPAGNLAWLVAARP